MIALKEFVQRRRTLMDSIGEGAVALFPSASMVKRNSDVDFPFRQNSDFYYLTGFDEPEALLLLRPKHLGGEVILFCQPRDPEMEIWNGYRTGPERAPEMLRVDLAYSIESLDEMLPELIAGATQLYYSIGEKPEFDQQVCGWLNRLKAKARTGVVAPHQLIQIGHLLHEQRLIKSEAEQQMMRTAGQISAEGHLAAMKYCKPGQYEYQLEAVIQHHFTLSGCRLPAYSSIVGGGKNACVLHYTENSDQLKEGDLVLIDAGCEYGYYAGDITRTFPVSGRFSDAQAELYQLVLDVQKACIEKVAPGVLWNEVHDLSVKLITEGLVRLGILEGEVSFLIESGAYRAYYMHRVGHWLGMDVHDVGNYKISDQWRPLQPGMVMTVEPGIYIAPDAVGVDARWRGIGIRIEDDVLVTEQGCEVLTAAVPTEIKEIEQWMAGDEA